jgi:hypothetical protein
MAPPTKKQKTCNVNTFILDDYVVSSPNAGPIQSFPPPESLSVYDDPDPNKAFSLNWIIPDYPYLAFVISPPRFDHPLLQRLNYTYHSLPIQSPVWKLAPSLAAQWEILEDALLFIANKVLPEGNQLYPLEFSVFHLPRTYGYLRSHRSEHLARKSAIRSRDAFVVLMALCSFTIARFHGAVLPADVEPVWVRVLQGPNGLNPSWLELFRSSPIPDFSGLYPRVGTVVDVNTWPYPHLVRRAVNAGVPVWFRWSKVDKPLACSPRPELEMYFPTREQIVTAFREHRHRSLVNVPVNTSTDVVAHTVNTVITSPPNTTDVSTLASHNTFPEPHPNSRQKRGETWMDFFERLEIRHKRILDVENDEERSARLARQAHAEKFLAPGKKGARVFLWQHVDGFLLRTLVNRGDAEELFEDTPHQHMRYNAFENEWDICEEFDPTAQIDDADPFGNDVTEYEELGEIPENNPPSITTATAMPAPTNPTMEATRQDIFAMFGREDSHSAAASPTFVGTLDYQLYLRFGFDCEGTQQPIPSDWNKTRNILQDLQSGVQDVYKAAIAEFVVSLLDQSVDNMPAISWDLSPTSSSFLRDRMGHYLSINAQVVEVLQSARSNIIGEPNTTLQETTYLLRQPLHHSSDNSVDWLLAVASPAVALQCVRFCSTNVADAARFCVQRGISFNTFARFLHPQSHPHVPHHRVTLGARPEGYVPDAADYAAYEAARTRFLQSSSARAALLKGGIVWRLAMEFMTPSGVLAGPSDIASTRGRVIRISGVGDFCDDELSENDIDIICGVYQVYTGKSIPSRFGPSSNVI